MRKFVKSNRILIITLLFVFSFGSFVASFVPTNNALKEVVVENFNHISTAKYVALNNSVQSEVENTRSMSSRSAIRTKIVEYFNGTVTYQELYDFSYVKYEDGYKVLDNAIQAVRVVDGNVLIDIGESILDTQTVLTDVSGVDTLEYKITEYQSKYQLEVISPIYSDLTIVGYDIILYSLDNIISSLQQEEYQVTIELNDQEFENTLIETGYENIYEVEGTHIYFKSLTSNYSIIITVEDSILFQEVRRINNQNIIVIILLAINVFIVGNFFFVRNARSLFTSVSHLQEHYRTKAMYDALTNTYSRQFLEQLLQDKSLRLKETTVVMTDVDGFKKINDNHGHLIGDEVLQFVGKCLLSSFRKDDYIIRYGGDEFLIIVNKASKSTTENIMKRINEIINQTSDFPFDISVSYGISPIGEMKDLQKGIEEADNALYVCKHKK